jgi:hypothetical protein
LFKNWLRYQLLKMLLPKGMNHGFQDICQNALWSRGDDRDVSDELMEVREHYIKPDTFMNKLERRFNDQTCHFERSGHLFEPVTVTPKKYDMVVLTGMSAISEMITNRRTRGFTYYRSGVGTKQESASDTALQQEHHTLQVTTDGFAEPAGSSAKFAGKFPYTAFSATISEAGLFDQAIGGVMLFRTVFPSEQRIVHEQYNTFFTLSQTVSMISIT